MRYPMNHSGKTSKGAAVFVSHALVCTGVVGQ